MLKVFGDNALTEPSAVSILFFRVWPSRSRAPRKEGAAWGRGFKAAAVHFHDLPSLPLASLHIIGYGSGKGFHET